MCVRWAGIGTKDRLKAELQTERGSVTRVPIGVTNALLKQACLGTKPHSVKEYLFLLSLRQRELE